MRYEEATSYDQDGIPVTTTWLFLEREEYHDFCDFLHIIYGEEKYEQIEVFRGARHIPLIHRTETWEPVFTSYDIETEYLSVCQEGIDHQAISIWAMRKRDKEGPYAN